MKVKDSVNTTLVHNKELANIFKHMSDCYQYLGPTERFRAVAYANAANTFFNMSEPVDLFGHDLGKLDELKGVGESIAAKVQEYLDTGTIQTFEKLKKAVPFELLDLMDIEGIGPATIRLFHDQLKVNTKEELIKAISKGAFVKLKGLGNNKKEALLQVLKLGKKEKERITLRTADIIGKELLHKLIGIKAVHRASLAGSLRRRQETVGDIDIVATADRRNWKKIINIFTSLPQLKRILARGETKASVILKQHDFQADLRLVNDDEFGSALFYFTGAKEHTIRLRTLAKKKGWKMNEYGVFDVKTNRKLAGENEAGIYALFGLPFISPEKRLGRSELDKAI